jgi:hypothetical protein
MTSIKYLTRDETREYLRSFGFPIARGTFNQLCAPSRGEGPPVAAIWPGGVGRHEGRPLYDPVAALAWAEARLKPAPCATP